MTLARTRRGCLRLLAAGLVGGGAVGSGVALTATSGWLIVRASEQPVILTLLTAIVAVRTFGIARPALRYWERLRSHDAALDDLARERTRTYAALVPLTPARLPRRGRAAMLSGVVDDLTERVEAGVRVTVPLVAVSVASVGAVLLCTLVDPVAAVAVLALVVVAAVTTFGAWLTESRGQAQVGAARVRATQVADVVAHQGLDLRAIGAEPSVLQWLRQAHADLAAAVRRQSRGRAAAAATLPLATALATVGCAVAALGSHLSAPVTALLVLAPFAMVEVFTPLPEVARAHARARAAGARVQGLLDHRPAVAGTGHLALELKATPPHLVLEAVTATWDGSPPALAATDLVIRPGQVVALTGPSGCGKSTLLAVLARHLDPSSGRYLLDGVDALDLRLEEVRALFAVVDDEPHLFATSLRENLRLARPGASDVEVGQALDSAGLATWWRALPRGLDTLLGTGGRGVSGGERARLAVARALLSGRPVLLLDEPVAHLDHATALGVLGDLIAARGDRSIVIVSHRPEGLTAVDGIVDLTRPTVQTP